MVTKRKSIFKRFEVHYQGICADSSRMELRNWKRMEIKRQKTEFINELII